MNKTNNPLKKFVTSKLYTRYSGILSLSDVPLFLVDINGDILFEFIPSPDFCTHVCQEKKSHVCPDYECMLKSGMEGRFVCRYGLENIIFPITVDNKTVGYMAGIQVYLKGNEYQKCMINIQDIQPSKELKTEELEFIAKSIFSLKSVESHKIKVYQQLCCEVAKNISIDLSKSTNFLHQDVKRLSIEKEILQKKIVDLETKNMSLVINPHFLFNTLNCIARVAYFEHAHETEELIYCLSDLLRYNLNQGTQLHTIGAEITNIEKYLYIQKVRFKTRLEYDINVSEDLKSYRILNMVIQPIVENSVIHGIAPRRDGGKISIYAEKYKEELVISIIDNGNGFPKDVLLDIQQCKNKSGLGFQNTDRRLKQYYGKQYGLKIVKSDYSGSTVTITIPAEPVVR